ncbi:coilin [Rhinatrema bivittatum]|uniref:coilin n=1 Tax=Rhinatrema bivittatum TaxID=194408 RepID=UPI00112B14A3|nr:coilin [Rhinatrema bivittatum]
MAVPGSGCVRVRLFFDYPPPGTPGCCMCWLLVDAKKCRVVTDLTSVIRLKFGFSERTLLSLFVDDCLLPPNESIMVVRDNDCIRVKLEDMKPDSSILDTFNDSSRKSRKRQRQKSEDEEPVGERCKQKKKIKQRSEMSPSQLKSVNDRKTLKKRRKRERNAETTTAKEDESSCEQIKKIKRKSEKEMDTILKNKRMKADDDFEGKMTVEPVRKNVPLSLTKGNSEKRGFSESRKQTAKSDSSETLSDSDQIKSSQKAIKKKDTLCPNSSLAAAKIFVTSSTGKIARSLSSRKTENTSSGSDSSTEDDSSTAKKKCVSANKHSPVTNILTQPQGKENPSRSMDSDSSHSESLLINSQKPVVPNPATGLDQSLVGNGEPQFTNNVQGPAPKPQGYGRGVGRGRGQSIFPWRGPRGYGDRRGMRGRGRGETNHLFFDYKSESQKLQQINEVLTNSSVVIQNPPEIPKTLPEVLKKDYSILPLLAAPPQIGEKIAFKLLELTENYTPEVSDYKEGKILSYSPVTHQIDVEILSSSPVVKEPGKFDLVYQSEDGTDVIEFAVPQDTKITKKWDSLIEPRLIVETSSDYAESAEPVKM